MRVFRLAALLCLALALLTGCSKTYSWNQKLTVTVMTPAGEVSASSVVEVTKVSSTGKFVLPEARGVKSTLRGEAVVLEVTPGKYLFVLLDGVDDLAHFAFPQITYEGSSEFGKWARQIEKHRGSGVVPADDYPQMVTFGDIDDPLSMIRLSPQGLDAHFGAGVELVSLVLEITSEPVSEARLEDTISWINSLEEYRTIPDNPFTSTLPRGIGDLRNK